jgi:hypothetical protein
MPAHTSEALAGLIAVRDELYGQYLGQRDELAWTLWKSCQPSDAAVRAPLAALLWTLGDPWWAHAVSREASVPSRGQLEGLLDVALRGAPFDPMLTSVGARLWGAPGMEMTGHEAMYRRLSQRWVASDAGRELEKSLATLGVSPSAAYSRALVSWFGGTLTDEERETIRSLQPFVASAYPAAAVRFLALHLLLNEENDPDIQEKWWRLAEHVRLVAADEHWHAQSDPYDRSMDLPFYYLEGASDECLTAIEGQRRTSLEFDLWNMLPPRPSEPEAQSLLNEEDNLLEEVRVLRYVSQLGRLPLWASQVYRTYQTDEDFRQEPAARWDDPDRARATLAEDRRRLNELAGELAAFAPSYAYIRRDPPGTLQDFAAMLTGRDGE